jgi:NAD(P)-dependent dehydrogenase (short-subunit alcohol dehydrogenase family)
LDLELTGKTALVTGASKGIGKAIARGLAREGVRVAICSRDSATLGTAAKEIAAGAKGEVLPIAGDLSRAGDVQRVVEDAVGRLGRLDILVNNAGAIRGGDFATSGWHARCSRRCRRRVAGASATSSEPRAATHRRPTCRGGSRTPA